ncbi:hypothetical protein MCAG_05547 [Micromonospora sp. ATCC 39149]|uniref:Uncharacterized protein n=1 Tax=Micromonospora carbonacea TaxID=47853 RepID=A0A7D6CGI4_9ACTN|nr:hypothetical protein [Micromonospora sp. ATCC 39149]EEP75220.1 hypothetical protein MCAG_05547 [Micromonospora sp. ATCC 39149]QLK00942.1 hypothetical protein HZU44_13690 [Micromonospora carbonacea]
MAGARQAQQWLLTLLPAFPVLLLVLRLWQLSRQDMSTMLLLVQYVSPLGLLSALLIALVWAFPLGVLTFGVLGRLLRLSAPERFDPERSLLASWTARTPGWVLSAAVALGALTWQLRFLPTLLMLGLWLLALRTRYLHPDQPTRILVVAVALPLAAAVLAYSVLYAAIVAAVWEGELTTAALLAVPPAAAVLLTGPIPGWSAPVLTHGLAYTVAAVLPLVMGAVFLRVPVLPTAAVELAPQGAVDASPGGGAAPAPAVRADPVVVLGALITVTDTSTIVLDRAAGVRFLPNGRVRSQVLCPEAARVPYSVVTVHGWPVEETVLDWMMPRRPVADPDVRCDGRLPAAR